VRREPKTIIQTIQTPADLAQFLPLVGLIIFVLIALFGVNFLKNHFKEKNILTEKQRFEIAKRKRMLKDLKTDYYKRRVSEQEYKDKALKIQAEIKELQKAKQGKKKP